MANLTQSAPASPPRMAVAIGGSTALAIGVTILAWASAFPAIRAGLAGFGPLELGAARFAIAALPAALYLLIARPALPQWREAWRAIRR